MSNPNTSEKSTDLDRQENITKGNVSAKKTVIYNYNSALDTIEPGVGGFNPNSDIDTEIVTVGDVKTITQTDGVKTCTITIDSTDPNDKLITKVWT